MHSFIMCNRLKRICIILRWTCWSVFLKELILVEDEEHLYCFSGLTNILLSLSSMLRMLLHIHMLYRMAEACLGLFQELLKIVS